MEGLSGSSLRADSIPMDHRHATTLPGTLFLFFLALAYLRLGLFIPLEFSDEGMIVYGIWRVSAGELPYRDFHQIYGPSTFFLGGALFRVFGADLAVLRYLVLAVKAALCVLVYLGARRLAERGASIVAYVVAVVLLGVSWPIVTTPYPNFFATAFCLAGVLLFLRLERRARGGAALAGLCFGIAATFKQTTGAFAFLAIALALLEDVRPAHKTPGRGLAILARASRWFVLVFSASLVVFYLFPRNPWWNFALLSSPALFLVGWLAVREYRDPPDAAQQRAGFERLVELTVSFLLPLGGYAILYGSLGLGEEILHDVFFGLPAATSWMVPFPPPDLTFFLWQLAIAGVVAAAFLARRSTARESVRGAYVSLLVSLAAVVALLFHAWPERPEHAWFWMSSDLLRSLPFWLAWLSIFGLLRKPKGASGTMTVERRASVVFTLYAAMAVLWLYPAADIWHVFAILPSCLPLLAQQVQLLGGRRTDGPSVERVARRVFVGVLGMALVLPAVLDLSRTLRAGRAFEDSIPRATGVRGAPGFYSPNGRDAEVVRYLRAAERREAPVFVLSGKPLFYFLADRVSPVQELEFVLYSVANNVIDAEQGRAFAGSRLVGELERTRPLIVEDDWDDRARNLRQAYPRLDRLLRRHYRVEETFGRYRVLRWYDRPGDPPIAGRERPGSGRAASLVGQWSAG